MVDRAIAVLEKAQHPNMVARLLSHYSNGAITTGTLKFEWVVPYYARIIDVVCDAETAGTGSGKNLIDVNINGTTIFTTQANRPTLQTTDVGLFTKAGLFEVSHLSPGDIVSYDVDEVPGGAGATRFKICIVLGPR